MCREMPGCQIDRLPDCRVATRCQVAWLAAAGKYTYKCIYNIYTYVCRSILYIGSIYIYINQTLIASAKHLYNYNKYFNIIYI